MDGSKPKAKSFHTSKRLVFEARMRVQANGGAPGVDAVSIGQFKSDEANNLYKVWNWSCWICRRAAVAAVIAVGWLARPFPKKLTRRPLSEVTYLDTWRRASPTADEIARDTVAI